MPSPLRKVIFVRSPYIVTINESSQTSSKINIFIHKGNEALPAQPTYTISKDAPSTTQTANYYNIAPYIKEAFDYSKPVTPLSPTDEDYNNWRLVRVSRYKNNGVFLDDIDFIAVNGYTNYLDGVNKSTTITTDNFQYVVPLINTDVPQIREINSDNYFNLLLINSGDYDNIYVMYYDATKAGSGTKIGELQITNTSIAQLYRNVKIPLSLGATKYQRVEITYGNENKVTMATIYSNTEEECKYTPMLCSFINKYGGWQFVTFFKANEKKIDIKAKEYKLLPENVAYDVYKGEGQMFNFELNESVKVNTGWVEEYFAIILKELMTSETILLDEKPVTLKTMNATLKQNLKDKNINYEVEFNYNYNQINNVV
jgi:hypothetical protein